MYSFSLFALDLKGTVLKTPQGRSLTKITSLEDDFYSPSGAVLPLMALPKAITTLCNTNSFPLCRMKLQKHPRHRIQHVDGQEIRVETTLMSLTEVCLFGTHCDLRDFTHLKAIGLIQPSFWVCKHLAPDKWRPYYPHFKGFLTLKALKQIFFWK